MKRAPPCLESGAKDRVLRERHLRKDTSMLFPHSSRPRASGTEYPHLVVRLMSAVYQVKAIPPGLTREQILLRTQHLSTSLDLRVAVVWTATHVTHVEPDGSRGEASEPPSGGVWMDVELPPLAPTTVAYAMPTRPPAAVRELAAWLVGSWSVRPVSVDGHVPPDAPVSRLNLRGDGTYTWHPSPTWSTGSGSWTVCPVSPGGFQLGLEDRDGLNEVRDVVRSHLPALPHAWDWQRTLSDAPLAATPVLRATRTRP